MLKDLLITIIIIFIVAYFVFAVKYLQTTPQCSNDTKLIMIECVINTLPELAYLVEVGDEGYDIYRNKTFEVLEIRSLRRYEAKKWYEFFYDGAQWSDYKKLYRITIKLRCSRDKKNGWWYEGLDNHIYVGGMINLKTKKYSINGKVVKADL